jgi:fructokinase
MRIGIDLGGTKIEGIALSPDGAELARLRVPTPRSYLATLEAITALVGDLESQTAATGSLGVGIPGALVPSTGLVKNANSTWLIGQPLQRDLEARLARPLRLANDANCFALSEATDGAGRGMHVVFGVILGTGVGGGIAIDQQPLEGANRIAGEWGHNPLPWPGDDERPGPPCYCGQRGCIEAWLSGPGFEADFERTTGRALSSREIVRAAAHDAEAFAALARYHERLARSLATVINLLDPDVIVLGGGMSNIGQLAESAGALLDRWVFSDAAATRVVRNVHGDSSGVRGAAWLWPG